MNNLDTEYQILLEYILGNGVDKADRTGTGTKSIFGWQIRHNMKEGFPLLTTKKMAWKTMVTELIWFLRGDTNIKFLVDNDCNIWNGDAYKNYISKGGTADIKTFITLIKAQKVYADQWGELGPIYGKQWRDWNGKDDVKLSNERDENGYLKFKTEHISGIDQIQNLINELKTNPDSRRLMVNAWNVGQLNKMTLPPCHYGFQMYTRELSFDERHLLYCKSFEGTSDTHKGSSDVDKMTEYHNNRNIPKRAISLMWNQRSVDTFLGLPFNIASYGLLLEIIAKEVNMVPDELIGNLGDVHLYQNHLEQAKEQISRAPFDLPKLIISDEVVWKEYDCLPSYSIKDFKIENYQSHPIIKAPLSN